MARPTITAPLALGHAAQRGERGLGLIGRAEQHQTPLICQIKRIEAEDFADAHHLGAQWQPGFLDLDGQSGLGRHLVQRRSQPASRAVAGSGQAGGRRKGCLHQMAKTRAIRGQVD